MSKDIFFWTALIFVLLSGYLGYKKRKAEAIFTAGIAGGLALAFGLYERIPWIISFLFGFIATVTFEWYRKR
ncbi:hypothetical protein [Pyrococcus kukulkanii]|uniref:Uncharacterized protein n=1 Tax=Pyrococcus kukulkanii TaxID=1609559 RepID=A0A127BAS8_9EURY|nr:hypothetical protein [Pyrococcus kukulkanii]AMM54357.1 hypothetical protein TQ32_07600 [Pyrococcus kukulkanii]